MEGEKKKKYLKSSDLILTSLTFYQKENVQIFSSWSDFIILIGKQQTGSLVPPSGQQCVRPLLLVSVN